MNRLTYDHEVAGVHCWQVKGADDDPCKDVCEAQGDDGCDKCPIRAAIDRLAAYENSGIAPEVAGKFRKAQREGRIAIVPQAQKGFRPLVTDGPQDNVATALNLFYVKDGWTWVRGGGPGPDYADVSLCDYIRQIAKEHGLDMAKSDDDDSISLEMSELLFDGTGTIEGIVATLYTAAWAFAELRERLKLYESTGRDPAKLLERRESPFDNDPFSMVWDAFKNLYPDKTCEVHWDQHQEDEHREEYGFTNFPDDGGTPQVFIYAEHPVNTQVETFGHELAHVAVGPEHEHDEVWEAAFDAIFKEYNRLGDLMFGKPKGEGGENEAD